MIVFADVWNTRKVGGGWTLCRCCVPVRSPQVSGSAKRAPCQEPSNPLASVLGGPLPWGGSGIRLGEASVSGRRGCIVDLLSFTGVGRCLKRLGVVARCPCPKRTFVHVDVRDVVQRDVRVAVWTASRCPGSFAPGTFCSRLHSVQ